MIPLEQYVTHRQDVVWRMVDNEAFIISSDGNKIHQLNRVGSMIWQLSCGTSTVQQIINQVCQNFEVPAPDAEHDVCEFVENMLSQGLVELRDMPSAVGNQK